MVISTPGAFSRKLSPNFKSEQPIVVVSTTNDNNSMLVRFFMRVGLKCEIDSKVKDAYVGIGIDGRTTGGSFRIYVHVVQFGEEGQQVVPAQVDTQRLDSHLA